MMQSALMQKLADTEWEGLADNSHAYKDQR